MKENNIKIQTQNEILLAERIMSATDEELEDLKYRLEMEEVAYRNRLLQRSTLIHTISDDGSFLSEETLKEIFKLYDQYDKEYKDALEAWNKRTS